MCKASIYVLEQFVFTFYLLNTVYRIIASQFGQWEPVRVHFGVGLAAWLRM